MQYTERDRPNVYQYRPTGAYEDLLFLVAPHRVAPLTRCEGPGIFGLLDIINMKSVYCTGAELRVEIGVAI